MKAYIGPLLISINVLFAVSLVFAFEEALSGMYYPVRTLLPWAIMAGEIILIRKAIKAEVKFSKLTLLFAYILLPIFAGLSLIEMYHVIYRMYF